MGMGLGLGVGMGSFRIWASSLPGVSRGPAGNNTWRQAAGALVRGVGVDVGALGPRFDGPVRSGQVRGTSARSLCSFLMARCRDRLARPDLAARPLSHPASRPHPLPQIRFIGFNHVMSNELLSFNGVFVGLQAGGRVYSRGAIAVC